MYIVTGAGGYLGGNVARMLCERGETVRAFVLPGERARPLDDLPVEVVRGDVRSPEDVERLFCDLPANSAVIHAASIVTVATQRIPAVEQVNIQGTRNIIRFCEREKARLVYVSSTDAIPAPSGGVVREIDRFDPNAVIGLYAYTKAVASQAVLDFAARGNYGCVVHPTVLLGPGDYQAGVVTRLLALYLAHPWLPCVHGGYDFVDVRDVAGAIVSAATQGAHGGECYILSGTYLSMTDVLNRILAQTGARRVRYCLPGPLATCVAGGVELGCKLAGKQPPFTRYALRVLVNGARFCSDKAKAKLGFAPRELDGTLEGALHFLREQGLVRGKAIQPARKGGA